jgi:hypothetical protein
MGLGKKLRSAFIQAMGFAATLFLILSLIVPQAAQIKLFYCFVSFEVPIYLFNFLTFELKLFSKKLWVRRMIVITFDFLCAIAMTFLFGYLRWERKHVIIYGIATAVGILIDIFSFYVADMIQKRNLEAINQKLAEQSKEN